MTNIGSGDLTLFTSSAPFFTGEQNLFAKRNLRLKYHCLFRMGESEEVKELERMLEEEERDS